MRDCRLIERHGYPYVQKVFRSISNFKIKYRNAGLIRAGKCGAGLGDQTEGFPANLHIVRQVDSESGYFFRRPGNEDAVLPKCTDGHPHL